MGESQRLPIDPDLPGDVHALLARMERLADARKLSFTRITAEISATGEKIQASHVRRWRSGKGFPSEPAVRRWTEICDGDVPATMALYAPAKTAYEQWKQTRRKRRGPAPSPPGDDPDRPGRRRRPAIAAAALVVVAAVVAAVVVVLVVRGRHGDTPADSCSAWWDGAVTAAPAPGTTAGTQLPFMYKVPSGPGSTDVVMTTGGSVLQPFRAAAGRIGQVGAIIGVDPRRGDVRAPHPVRFEILEHVDGHRPVMLGWAPGAVTEQNNNKDVIAEFSPPVVVTEGHVYALRVIDQAGPVGVYVNAPTGAGRTVPYVAEVCATEPLEPFEPAGRMLAGFVSGTT